MYSYDPSRYESKKFIAEDGSKAATAAVKNIVPVESSDGGLVDEYLGDLFRSVSIQLQA
eukprot:CAMPEP_0185590940 /NCGR_PEP_ID=MMETSP0434-20130131/62709_1 /TAXON_ID=626734 ORGANISM="Favella taraikaensis, Strain Fe Narragansett Bay" /NCGR_SAMPLE_ID=MMETSP0434 /ASSEMBLY_ACC=CAM_ASM_000379 /LENGTH=58 /DNA_ID=CAMNT_0028215551 /DNA_START=720 /DNA_END=896 /DNA_ORIENTATION=-